MYADIKLLVYATLSSIIEHLSEYILKIFKILPRR